MPSVSLHLLRSGKLFQKVVSGNTGQSDFKLSLDLTLSDVTR